MPAESQPPNADRTREFLDLHSRHARWIYGYLLGLVRNQADAEDLFSETTATLWEKFADFESGTEFRGWACRVAQLKVLEFRKKQSRAPSPVEQDFIEAVTQAHESMAPRLDAQSEHLEECLEELVAADQDLITRRYAADADVKSLAATLGKSVHQVYRRLNSIHDSLRNCVKRKASKEAGE